MSFQNMIVHKSKLHLFILLKNKLIDLLNSQDKSKKKYMPLKKWTMPIQNWGIVLNQFMLIFEKRLGL
jgi:hypothetical protein